MTHQDFIEEVRLYAVRQGFKGNHTLEELRDFLLQAMNMSDPNSKRYRVVVRDKIKKLILKK